MTTKHEAAQRVADTVTMESSLKSSFRIFGTGRIITTCEDQPEGEYSKDDIAPEVTRIGMGMLAFTSAICSRSGHGTYRRWLELNKKLRANSNEVTLFESKFK